MPCIFGFEYLVGIKMVQKKIEHSSIGILELMIYVKTIAMTKIV